MILEYEITNDIIKAVIVPREASVDNAETFKNEMLFLINKGARYIILNFQNVGYVDSTFLGSLVIALKYAISKNADIYLIELKPDIYNLLTLIRMDKVFKIYKNYQDAAENIVQ